MGGGVLIFAREDIPSRKLSKHTFPTDIEALYIEINLRKSKFLLVGIYHPPNQADQYYFDNINKALDMCSHSYDKVLLSGDFNAQEDETVISNFIHQNNLKNIVKEKPCFKNPQNPTCIDLFLNNFPNSFQNTSAFSTRLPDFHKMIVTVLKTTFSKSKPIEMFYRCYKTYDHENFRKDLRNALTDVSNYAEFETAYMNTLNKHAPYKKKTVRPNQAPYMTKTLRKAIMRRSALQNKLYKDNTLENDNAYRKQRNFCSKLYKKVRRKFYDKLDTNNINDNKLFWKTVKPFPSDKGTL